MSVPSEPSVWNSALELTVSCQRSDADPSTWAIRLSSFLRSSDVALPSPDLAHLLVSHICWSNHVPLTWKYLEKAFSLNLVPPLLSLALLSTRVIPNRHVHPAAYTLYMEILKRHFFSLSSHICEPSHRMTMRSIDNVLNLSEIFGLESPEPGVLLAVYIFSIAWQLADASLDDEGLLDMTIEPKSKWPTYPQEMEIDDNGCYTDKKREGYQGLHKINTSMAIEVISELLQNKVISRIMYLVRENMSSHWGGFTQRIQLLSSKSTMFQNSKYITPEILLRLSSDTCTVLSPECKRSSQKQFHAVMSSGSLIPSAGQSQGASSSALWLPIDIFLEDAMDGSQVVATSAIQTLTGLVKALRAVNKTSWHNTFLGLWIAALRLVQREKEPCEGPVPRLDSCLSMLLSITPLVVVHIIEEEESSLLDENICAPTNHLEETQVSGKCRMDLISSLKVLGDYEGLLTPPQPLSLVANQAAAKAVMHISSRGVSNGSYESINDMALNCSGNMRHLIVEACIARELIDTSAYLWPGYVNARGNQMPHIVPGQMLGWSSLMKGSPLTTSLINSLVSTPASSLSEIEKIYEIAIDGSNDQKISAANILCGATLSRGWNIQEHTVALIIRLLSPPIPADYSGSDSHLISYGPFLNALVVGISTVDNVQIFSLHGLVPRLAGALMPMCEVFGSCTPVVSWTLPSGEEISPHAVFSNAFILLLKLWRFHLPPMEFITGDVTPVGSQLSPEYLLMVRNSQLMHSDSTPIEQIRTMRLPKFLSPSSSEPITMDCFPKLNRWHQQLLACIASTLSGLVPGTPVHQIVEGLLTMMFRKINKTGHPMTPTTGSSNSSSSGSDDASVRLKIPAWDILEAVPFVLDAALTACGHERLSPRELATGLKDLADFLPASLATVLSYFSAEVTRGIWKPAFMNGTDWPSPSVNLSKVEEQINKILATTGVDVPSLAVGGNSPATLPLPLAALVSLTITYKLDRDTDRFLYLIAPGLHTLAAGCPWPCMPIVAALWAQKVKRWSDFLIFCASRTVFHHNNDAVVQLLKSCFRSTLGLSSSPVCSSGGIGALLGHGSESHLSGGFSPVAPGILYLRVHRAIRDVTFLKEEILSVLMHSVTDIARGGLPVERSEKLKSGKWGMKYGEVSLAALMTRIKLAASLGASLVWVSGGVLLVQVLIKETLPSWFISVHRLEHEARKLGGMVAMLGGYALAFLALFSGTFAWGIDSAAPASRRRSKILGAHLEFVASALDGHITLGCDWATWRAYVLGFISLMVRCTPMWVLELDVALLKRLSHRLMRWKEEELAMALLGAGGVGGIGAAVELIIESGV